MRFTLGLSLVAAGAVLLWLGLRASESFASGVTRLFSGSPTKESVMLLTGGAATAAAGVCVALTAARRPKWARWLRRRRTRRKGR